MEAGAADPDTRSGWVLDQGPQEDKEICDLAITAEVQLPGLEAPVELAAYWSDLEQAAVVPTTYSLRVALDISRQAAVSSVRSLVADASIREAVLRGCDA